MPEFLTSVMIEKGSNKLRIRLSEPIKPEPLDKRIFDMTKSVNWSTFKCGLHQLKSRKTLPREVSDLVLTNILCRILITYKFQIRSYLLLDQRKKNNAGTNKQKFFCSLMVYVMPLKSLFLNSSFSASFLTYPGTSCTEMWGPSSVPAREKILFQHWYPLHIGTMIPKRPSHVEDMLHNVLKHWLLVGNSYVS